MARLSAFLLAAAVAVALVCGATSTSAADETAVLHRSKRFSIEGILTCVVGVFTGMVADIIREIEKECLPLGNGLLYRACALSKFAKFGPAYLGCVIFS